MGTPTLISSETILLAYFFIFLIAYGLAVEFVPQVVKGRGDVLIFLRKHKAFHSQNSSLHEEKNDVTSRDPRGEAKQITHLSRTTTKLGKQEDCFTWDKIQYQIPVRGGSKSLLTDIHGFVKPGTMTGKSYSLPLSPHTYTILTKSNSIDGRIRRRQNNPPQRPRPTNPHRRCPWLNPHKWSPTRFYLRSRNRLCGKLRCTSQRIHCSRNIEIFSSVETANAC